MRKFKKIGFVSVELVIMAAIILSSGIAGIVVMGDKGSQAMKDGMDKLDSLGFFGGEVVTPSFSSSWYHPSLNIEEGDVNSPSDFVFVLNPDGSTYTITDYTNMTDKTVVIPKFHNDGKTITGIGDDVFRAMVLTSVALHNGISAIGDSAFFNNEISEIALPASITSLGDYAFKDNNFVSVTFQGMLPTVLGTGIFEANEGLGLRTVAVPSGYVDIFKSAAVLLGVPTYAIYDPKAPHDPKAYDGTWYHSSLNIKETDINPVSDFTFTFNSTTNTYTITGYTNLTDKTLVIPKYHTDGYLIAGVGSSVFRNKQLTSAALPNSLTTIGSSSFASNSLTSLFVPDSLKTIGGEAFRFNSFSTLTFLGPLPAAQGMYPFYFGSLVPNSVRVPSAYLTSYKIGAAGLGLVSSSVLGIIDGDENLEGGFGYQWEPNLNGWEIFHYQNKTLKNVVIPAKRLDGKPVVSIGERTFSGVGLTTLYLPEGLKAVKLEAFYKNNIPALTIPNSLTTFGKGAFNSNLIASLVVPASVHTIYSDAFANNKLTSLTFLGPLATNPGTLQFNYNPLTTGSIKVYSAYLTSYQSAATNWLGRLPSDFTIIDGDENVEGGLGYQWNTSLNGWEVFHYQDRSIKNITIPSTRANGQPIVSVAAHTFENAGLTSLTLSEGMRSIGESAFRTNLITSLALPNSITTIGTSAFFNNRLVSLTIPASVTSLGSSAFRTNPLTSVRFLGALPTNITASPTTNFNIFGLSTALVTIPVSVPLPHLSSYQAARARLGLSASSVITGQ